MTVSKYYLYRDDMNNANAIPAHGEHYFSQFCRADVVLCAHVTLQTGAIGGQEEELAIPATGAAFFVPRWEDSTDGFQVPFAWPWLQQFVGHCA